MCETGEMGVTGQQQLVGARVLSFFFLNTGHLETLGFCLLDQFCGRGTLQGYWRA